MSRRVGLLYIRAIGGIGKQNVTINVGECPATGTREDTVVIDAVEYSHEDIAVLAVGDHTLTWSSVTGCEFSSWTTTGAISVADPNAESTTLTVSGAGTLTLVVAKSTLFSSGFETGDYTEWTRTVGPPVIDTTVVHDGSYSSKSTGDSWYTRLAQQDYTFAVGNLYRLHGWFRCDAFDDSAMGPPWSDYIDDVLSIHGTDATDPIASARGVFFALRGIAEDTLKLYLEHRVGGSSTFTDTGITLALAQWYKTRLEIYVHATAGYAKLYINDELKAQKTAINTTNLGRFSAGSSTSMWATGLASRTSYVDTILLDDPKISCKTKHLK